MIIFIPQIALLVAFVAVLEASGYMARAAFLLDRPLRQSRSERPLLRPAHDVVRLRDPRHPGQPHHRRRARSAGDDRGRAAHVVLGAAAGVRRSDRRVLSDCLGRPGPLRALSDRHRDGSDRRVVPAALGSQGRVVGSHDGTAALQRPALRVVGNRVGFACREFIITAGTIIFATAVVIWAASYYPRSESVTAQFAPQRQAAEALPEAERAPALAAIDAAEHAAFLENSYLARAGKAIQPVFAPAGFDWRTTVGVVAAFPARELIVPTLGILHSLGDVDAGEFEVNTIGEDDGTGLRARLRNATDEAGNKVMGPLVALSILVFFALCSQCAATLGAISARDWVVAMAAVHVHLHDGAGVGGGSGRLPSRLAPGVRAVIANWTWQDPVALALVAVTVAWFVARHVRRRRAGGACGCTGCPIERDPTS